MRFIVSEGSDVGRVKEVNEDSLAIKHIYINNQEIVFAVLCDGMGGFDSGEVASASVVEAFMQWFNLKFLKSISIYTEKKIFEDWKYVINKINDAIFHYGEKRNIQLGTTVTIMLIKNAQYYIANIGDGRVYELSNKIRQITIDHSVIEREIQAGRLTRQEARFDNRRNQILKCIGITSKVEPDFFSGKIVNGGVYIICCDGVRNKVYDDELFYYFHPEIMTTQFNMNNNIKYIFSLNKKRKENDNMSMILVKNSVTTLFFPNEYNQIIIEDEKIIVHSKTIIHIDI